MITIEKTTDLESYLGRGIRDTGTNAHNTSDGRNYNIKNDKG